jgi:hypothetical protein
MPLGRRAGHDSIAATGLHQHPLHRSPGEADAVFLWAGVFTAEVILHGVSAGRHGIPAGHVQAVMKPRSIGDLAKSQRLAELQARLHSCVSREISDSTRSAARRCERQDLNLHGFPHWILSPARLPIPPLSQSVTYYQFESVLRKCQRGLFRPAHRQCATIVPMCLWSDLIGAAHFAA